MAAVALWNPGARGTWSIVVADKSTGEIAVGCATCLSGIDLQTEVPVVLPGIGAACAQSLLDNQATNRRIIWDELKNGTHPKDIMDILAASDGQHGSRQYGIVDILGRRAAHTGNGAGSWAGHVRGQSGSLVYAVQGNVLAGQPVVDEAVNALLNTPGDLPTKLMAAMSAAALMGGDGRCSCGGAMPDGCGAPPPGFDPLLNKSAHVGFMIVARIGDRQGRCTAGMGCANGGEYYLNFNIAPGTGGPPDPTIEMEQLFQSWELFQRGTSRSLSISSHLAGVRARQWHHHGDDGHSSHRPSRQSRDARGSIGGSQTPGRERRIGDDRCRARHGQWALRG